MKAGHRGLSSSIAAVTIALFGLTALSSAQASPGDLVPDYGDHGVTSTLPPSGKSLISNDVALDPSNGSTIVVGSTEPGTQATLARYLVNGNLDLTFGTNGFGDTTAGRWDRVQVLSDGKILTAGRDGTKLIVGRFNSNGSLDNGFGSGGIVSLNPGPLVPAEESDLEVAPKVTALRVLDGGRIRFAGTTVDCRTNDYNHIYYCFDLFLAALNPDGSPEAGYGDGSGLILPDVEGISQMIDISPSGVTTIASTTLEETSGGDQNNFETSRFDSSGNRVATYGSKAGPDNTGPYSKEEAAAVDPAGRLVIAVGPKLLRFDKDGLLDETFRSAGIADLTRAARWVGRNPYLEISKIGFDNRGRILLSGGITAGGGESGLAASGFVGRLMPGGDPDATFSSDGLAIAWSNKADLGVPKAHRPNSTRFTRRSDGSIVIAGKGTGPGKLTFTLAAVNGESAPLPSCHGKPADYVGTSSADVVKSYYAGIIVTGSGNDEIDNPGATICAGTGDDSIQGEGSNRVYAGPGDDRVSLHQGRNLVFGGSGDDAIKGGSRKDRLNGGSGSDHIKGGGEDDAITGGPGRDALIGNGRNDELSGGDDADRLLGNSGYDKLWGQGGKDRLDAGTTGPEIDEFKGKSPGLTFKLDRKGGKAIIHYSIDLHCYEGEIRSSRGAFEPLAIKRGSGRFHYHAPGSRDIYDVAYFDDIDGRIRGNVVTGRVRSVESDHWSDNYTCLSGKGPEHVDSLNDIWVPFKARLQPKPRQFEKQ